MSNIQEQAPTINQSPAITANCHPASHPNPSNFVQGKTEDLRITTPRREQSLQKAVSTVHACAARTSLSTPQTHRSHLLCRPGSGGSRGGVRGVRTPPEIPGKSFCTWKINLYLLRNKVSKCVWLDLSPEDDQNRGEDIKISKIFLGETPLRQNNQSQYNGLHNLIKLKSMKWQQLFAIFAKARVYLLKAQNH